MATALALALGAPFSFNLGVAYDPVVALGAKLQAYWDADRSDRIMQDGLQRVSSWVDLIAGYNPVQATDALKPTYEATSFNGRALLRSDGTQYLTLASVALPSGGAPCEVWVLGQNAEPGSTAGLKTVFCYGNTGSAGQGRSVGRVGSSNINRLSVKGGTGAADLTATGGTVNLSGNFVAQGVFAAGGVTGRANGIADGAASGTLGGTATTRTRVFANASTAAANIWNGGANKILVTSPLSAGEAAALESWLARLGGVVLPETPGPFDYSSWLSITGSTYSYDGNGYSIHSAQKYYSIARALSNANLFRFEIRQGDQWSDDIGRTPAKDRAELGGFPGLITANQDFYVAFAMRTTDALVSGQVTVFQIFGVNVEFQLISAPDGTRFRVYSADINSFVDVHVGAVLVAGTGTQFVLRMKLHSSQGELQAWRDGAELFNVSGLAFGADESNSRLKFGAYRTVAAPTFAIETANVKIGADLSSYIAGPPSKPASWL